MHKGEGLGSPFLIAGCLSVTPIHALKWPPAFSSNNTLAFLGDNSQLPACQPSWFVK